MMPNGAPHAKKASAAPCLGQGCQEEESSDGTTSQHSSWHGGSFPLAQRGRSRCRWCSAGGSRAPRGARGSITPRPKTFFSFLSLLGRFLKQKFSLSEVFRGRWRESRKPKRIVLLVKAFNNYF